MDELVRHHGLTRFDQYAKGTLVFENERGEVEHGRGFSSMAGSHRVEGGFAALINAIAADLPHDRVHLSMPVAAITQGPDSVNVTTSAGLVTAKRVVLALPQRLASQFKYTPPLPAVAHQAMDDTATWMAGQAKALAIFETPFWRDAGLSGDAMSRHGPMVEIHDASPMAEGPYALFGFIGLPPHLRRDPVALEQAVAAQFVRLFGPQAATPIALTIKDWASDLFTATQADQQPLYAHPTYNLARSLQGLMNGRIVFAGTESAPQYGGYLEGALEAAENALALLEQEKA